MSEKIKVGNAEVEKATYDYFLLQYSKMSKEYVIADLVSKCEDYGRLYNAYEKLEVKKIQKENIIKEVREFVEKWKYEDGDGSVYFDINTNPDDLLRILDKGE